MKNTSHTKEIQRKKKSKAQYKNSFEKDPFGEHISAWRKEVHHHLKDTRREKLTEITENTDMRNNGKITSATSGVPRTAAVTPNQIACKLIMDKKPKLREKHRSENIKK